MLLSAKITNKNIVSTTKRRIQMLWLCQMLTTNKTHLCLSDAHDKQNSLATCVFVFVSDAHDKQNYLCDAHDKQNSLATCVFVFVVQILHDLRKQHATDVGERNFIFTSLFECATFDNEPDHVTPTGNVFVHNELSSSAW